MNKQAVAKELVAIAKVLAAKKPKYTSADIDKLIKGLRECVERGGRDYGDYQFDIKLQKTDIPDNVRELYGESQVSEFAMEEAADRVRQLGGEVKRRFGWVKDWAQSGRSGGWFCIEDNDSTMDTLEEAYGPVETLEGFDKLSRDERGVWYQGGPWDDEDELWDELTKEAKGAIEEGQRKLKDLAEIDKMVKSGIADYRKDMNSERWWKDMLE